MYRLNGAIIYKEMKETFPGHDWRIRTIRQLEIDALPHSNFSLNDFKIYCYCGDLLYWYNYNYLSKEEAIKIIKKAIRGHKIKEEIHFSCSERNMKEALQ